MKLLKKVELIVEKYVKEDLLSLGDDKIATTNQSLFLSANRFHRNIHLSNSELVDKLSQVNQNAMLSVKENMVIPKTLKAFLNKKHRQTSHMGRLTINELFEPLLPNILELYVEKLEIRDAGDEFGLDDMEDSGDIEKLFAGMGSKDLIFYEKTFRPAALYFVYKEIHKSNFSDEEVLMNDIFTMGAGAESYDLIPEIVATCSMCSSISSEQPGQVDIESLNRKVFNMQLKDKFHLEGLITSSDDSSNISSSKEGSAVTQISEKVESLFNPFSSSVEKSPENINLPFEDLFSCTVCPKQFTREDFLIYHKELFHKKSMSINEDEEVSSASNIKVIVPRFVDDEAPELMQTFYEGGGTSTSELSTKHTRSRSGVRKILKYPK